MTDDANAALPAHQQTDARDLQARLYREIGISAVAAALRFIGQPDPDKVRPAPVRDTLPILREDDIAA